jgi:hypothetical protein
VGKRGRHKGSQGRAENRVRGRVREGVQKRSGRSGESSSGRRRGTFDVGDIERYANRLTDHVGSRDASRLSGAASGLAGAASGLAGGSLARGILENDAESSEEDFRNEVRGHLNLMDERLQRLEDEIHALRVEGGEDIQEPEGVSDPDSSL